MASAENIPKWIDFIREAGKKDIKIYVIGNKSDLRDKKAGKIIHKEDGEALAKVSVICFPW